MGDIELEEGEAFGYSENDGNNINPDQDFSYIVRHFFPGDKRHTHTCIMNLKFPDFQDKRIQDVLGQYQRDFMGDISTGNLGARYGCYGSFLPAYQQSPYTSSHSVTLSYFNSRSSNNLMPEAALFDSVQANGSLPQTCDTSSECGVQSLSVAETSPTGQLINCLSAGECIAEDEHKAVPNNRSTQKTLKVRIKVGCHSILAQNKSAIYSGLGLDMSPSSSVENTPLKFDGASSGMLQMLEGSPSGIIEIVTSFAVPDGKLLSPLMNNLVCLTSNNLVDGSDPCLKRREEDETLMGKEVVSKIPVDSFDVHPEAMVLASANGKVIVSKHAFTSNEKSESRCTEEVADKSMKQGQVAKVKAKEPVWKSSVYGKEAGIEGKAGAIRSTQKAQKDEKVSSLLRKNTVANEANEVGCTDSGKSLKEWALVKHNGKEEELASASFQGDGLDNERRTSRLTNKFATDKKACSIPKKDADENDKIHNINKGATQGMKNQNSGSVETLKANSDLKTVSDMQMGAETPEGMEHLLLATKKKSKGSQTGGRSTAALPNVSLRVGSSAIQTEETAPRNEYPKNKRDNMKSHKELRSSKVSSNKIAGERSEKKEMSVKNSMFGVLEGDTLASNSKLKEKLGAKRTGCSFKIESNSQVNIRNDNLPAEMASTSSAPAEENDLGYEADNWVQCDRCCKWRLLPYDINPDSLPQKWICRMLNWLPAMNKCSFSEDETTNALLALYQVPGPVLDMQNIQPGYPNGGAAVVALAAAQHGCVPRQLTSVESVPNGGKKRDLKNSNTMKDQWNTVGFGDLKKLSQSSVGLNSVCEKGDTKPVITEKKRVADQDAYGVPKKVNRAPLQFKDTSPADHSEIDNRHGQNCNRRSSEASKDFARVISLGSLKKIECKTQKSGSEEHKKNVSRKRKLKDQHHSVIHTNSHHCKQQNSVVNRVVDTSVITCDPVGEGFKKLSSGKHPSDQGREKQPDFEAYKHANRKSDSIVKDKGTCTSHTNLASKDHGARFVSHIDSGEAKAGDVASDTSKLKYGLQSGRGRDNLSWPSPFVSESKKGDGSEVMELPKQLRDGGVHGGDGGLNHASLRRPRADLNASKDIGASGSVLKDCPNWAARTALREATDLKHFADRMKIAGSDPQSAEIFFQAALKFLHGAALLEHGNTESGGCREMTSVEVYCTTAKLCLFCAHEFERCNDMACAALAYKCMEVAYMRVVYSNDFAARRDRQVLEATLRADPPVESPSSSASDIDNLNNHGDTYAAKELRSSVVHGNHAIPAGNMQNFVQLLNFAQDVHHAMESSRKCQSAFAAAHSNLSQMGNAEGISSVKRALDFSFHDVDALLRLVRLAMEALSG
ncbi:hypothetical protein Nepgr_009588 [Nepenthes gracilis]|uniref:CW-type domain-containing protein n=1 Tax=Nepenthes gracilis TaxID=150966 RepID=A0AAD3SAS1_NEPGR|nr:hypothetical protein Nepgr_009588 [Nepenthes gracilis]